MKRLMTFFKSGIWSLFKLIEEIDTINILTTISTDARGMVQAHLSPMHSDQVSKLYPHKILANKLYTGFLSEKDIRLVKSLMLAEGDIFLLDIEYLNDKKTYHLTSHLTKESWHLTKDEINTNHAILSRMNKRFLTSSFSDAHN